MPYMIKSALLLFPALFIEQEGPHTLMSREGSQRRGARLLS